MTCESCDMSQSIIQILVGRRQIEPTSGYSASVREQARFIRSTLSLHSSANNHLIGELVGLLAAAVLFPELPEAARWRDFAFRALVREAGVRMRDMGQVFHVEAFVVPRRDRVSTAKIDAARRAIAELDWKMQDVSVVVVTRLPEEVATAHAV